MTTPIFSADLRLEKRAVALPQQGDRPQTVVPVWTFAPLTHGDETPPLVFTLHGMNSRKESQFETAARLAQAGFFVVAPDSPGHGERLSEEMRAALAGAFSAPAFARSFGSVVTGAARELGPLCAALGYESYAVVGHSMGGYIALQAGATDARARVVVNVAGSPDWTLAPNGQPVPTHLIADSAQTESPLARAEAFHPRPLLLLHGDRDEAVSILGPRALYARLASGPYQSEPDRLALVEYPGVGHVWLPDMTDRAIEWLTRFHRPNQNA